MTNAKTGGDDLPRATVPSFEEVDLCGHPQAIARQVSADGTRKYVVRFPDGALAEVVGIPYGDPAAPSRLTACFSTQAGCAMRCAFCATGRLGLTRNLTVDEIVWEVALVGRDFGRRLDCAIAMGQGEPLANYGALVAALAVMGSREELGLGVDDLTVSTCGIPEGIRSLATDRVSATLAVSLHAARQELRDELMPGVRAFPLGRLRDALGYYNATTGRHVVVQYLMLGGVNDGRDDLEALASFCQGLDARVSFLQYNRVEGIPFVPSTFGTAALWCMELNQRGIPAGINNPRGADIHAACGQLAARL